MGACVVVEGCVSGGDTIYAVGPCWTRWAGHIDPQHRRRINQLHKDRHRVTSRTATTTPPTTVTGDTPKSPVGDICASQRNRPHPNPGNDTDSGVYPPDGAPAVNTAATNTPPSDGSACAAHTIDANESGTSNVNANGSPATPSKST